MIVHTHDYDSSYHPAMPVVEIEVRRRRNQAPLVLEAIVDSGADATMIPLPYLSQLQARKVHTRWLHGIAGGRYEVDLFTVAIQFGDRPPKYVDVVGTEQGDEVILGRDLLNQYIVTLNAPAHVVEVSV